MVVEAGSQALTPISRIDPRARLVAALALSLALAFGRSGAIAVAGLATAVALTAAAHTPVSILLRRLVPLNVLLLALVLSMSVTRPLGLNSDELRHAGVLVLKANGILLLLTALVGTIETVRLGHALESLGLPVKLTRLFLFTVRYLDVLHREYGRMRRSMKARGFRARLDRHTLRTFGYLVGMLLVRAFDRSERTLRAMKCRGFDGHFHPYQAPRLRTGDALFAAGACVLAVAFAGAGWL